MTENRQRPTPPPRTAPFVTPSNGNGAPPPAAATTTAPPPPVPNPDIMTQDTIRTAVTEIALLLKNPELLTDNRGAAMENFRQLTRAAVGDDAYHKIYTSAVTGLLEKGGNAGTEMIEKVQRRIDDSFAAQNDMVTSVRNARIFGADDTKFRKNYRVIGAILENAIEKHGQTLQIRHTDTKDTFVKNLDGILEGSVTPVISNLTHDEKKKHIPVPEMV